MNSLDWNKIEKEYVLAYESLQDWFIKNGKYDYYIENNNLYQKILKSEVGNVNILFDIRKLYDFFDDKGISLYIIPDDYPTCFFVVRTKKKKRDYQVIYNNRKECEVSMFMEAFNILDNYLNKLNQIKNQNE